MNLGELKAGEIVGLRFRDGEAQAEIRTVTILEERKEED